MKTTERATTGSLATVLPRLPHHMEMINRTINGGYPLKLGVPLVEALEHDLVRFTDTITRWVGSDTQPGLYEALASLKTPLATLHEYFRAPEISKLAQEDVSDLVAFIYDRIRELRAIAAAISPVYTWQSGIDAIPNPVDAEKHITKSPSTDA